MNSNLEIMMDDSPVTFTSNGKVNLVEAISALAGSDSAGDAKEMLEALKIKNPQIDQYVEYTEVSGEEAVPVTGSRGWQQIQTTLFDHILDISD